MSILTKKIREISIVLVDLERATTSIAESFKFNIKMELASGSKNFIFDLSACEFVDSTFLSALVTSYKRIAEVDGNLRIVGLKPSVMAMFELIRLTKIFDIYGDEKEALNSFK